MGCCDQEKPVFFIGMPRSGTTILFEAFARHPQVGWLSGYSEMYPKSYWLNIFCRILDNKIIRLGGRKRQHATVRFGNRYLPMPDEAYNFWDTHCLRRFSKEYLINEVSTSEEKEAIRFALARTIKWQGKSRFSAKLTGPARIGYLQSIFSDAVFVHVIRDGRSVVHSLLKVPFWREGGGLENPWWEGGLPQEYLDVWKSSSCGPAVLAAVQWRAVIELARKEARQLKNQQYVEVRYESFMSDPHQTLLNIYEACKLPDSQRAHDYIDEGPQLRNMNRLYKNSMDVECINQVTGAMQPLLAELGYA